MDKSSFEIYNAAALQHEVLQNGGRCHILNKLDGKIAVNNLFDFHKKILIL